MTEPLRKGVRRLDDLDVKQKGVVPLKKNIQRGDDDGSVARQQ